MERVKRWKKKILGSCRSHRSNSPHRLGHRLVVFTRGCLTLSSIGLIGCTTLKKASIVSLGAGGGALAGTVLSGGAAAPILGATASAFVTDVVTEAAITKKASGTVLQTEQGMIECAPDNFWSLLGQLVETGGWLLVLVIAIPMIFSWLLPGPVKFKGKEKKPSLFSS